MSWTRPPAVSVIAPPGPLGGGGHVTVVTAEGLSGLEQDGPGSAGA
jgi:hypothetical protein